MRALVSWLVSSEAARASPRSLACLLSYHKCCTSAWLLTCLLEGAPTPGCADGARASHRRAASSNTDVPRRHGAGLADGGRDGTADGARSCTRINAVPAGARAVVAAAVPPCRTGGSGGGCAVPRSRPDHTPGLGARLMARMAGPAPFPGTIILTRTPGRVARAMTVPVDEPDDYPHAVPVSEALAEPVQDASWWARLLAVVSFRRRWELLGDDAGT